MPISNKLLIYYFICFLLICVSAVLIIKDGHSFNGDFALYYEQSVALFDGSLKDLYFINKQAMDNSAYLFGPYLYPMGFPIILAPLTFFFNMNFMLLKYYTFSFLIGSCVLLYFFLKNKLKSDYSVFFVIVIFAFNAKVITYADGILSDFPFLFFIILSLLLIEKSVKNIYWAIIAGLFIFFSYIIRDLGICLLPAIVFFHLKEIRNKGNFRILILTFTSLFIFSFLFLAQSFYFDFASNKSFSVFLSSLSLELVLNNAFSYYKVFAVFFEHKELLFIFPIFLILFFLGFYKRFIIDVHIALFLVFFVSILLLWPFVTTRFMFPAILFFLYFTMQGVSALNIPVVIERNLLIAYFTISIVFNFYRVYQYSTDPLPNSYTSELQSHYSFIKENISIEDDLVFFRPRLIRLYTGHNAYYQELEDLNSNFKGFILLELTSFATVPVGFDIALESDNFILLKKE